MEPDPKDLRAGYAYLRGRGVTAYAGVLREVEREHWRCPHEHLVPAVARRCSDAELERRRQGAREVMVLLHCADDGVWYDPAVAAPIELATGRCPLCGTPLDREKIIVLEREEVRVRASG